MATKRDEKLAKFFADSFKEVVLPSLDKLQDTVDEVKESTVRIESRVEKIDDRLDRQGKVQDDLQERVEVLESHAPVID